MPLQATSGAASYDAFGGGAAAAAPNYIEEVFQTWLYTGTGATLTITNGIDLSTKGGMVWAKDRTAANSNWLYDTIRGVNASISSNLTNAQGSVSGVTAFNTNGFGIGTNGALNTSSNLYASWTFREQAKFFDVVTYTGTGSNTTIAHALGSVPGSIFVKRTDTTGDWQVYHRSLANTEYMVLNTTAAKATGATRWNSTTPTSTVFSLGTDATVNASAGTYVAYVFAHNAGGFGLTGADNVISCGSFTTDGSGNATVNLGYEVQWVTLKASPAIGSWYTSDIMRGMTTAATNILFPHSTSAELDIFSSAFLPEATGFSVKNFSSTQTFIYIAIRRGPMKVPTVGTSVYSPLLTSSTSGATNTTNFPVDLQLLSNYTSGSSLNFITSDRLRGVSSNSTETGNFLVTTTTAAESGAYLVTEGWNNTAFLTPSVFAGTVYLTWNFKRAPSYFDEVCYTGTGSATTQTHNLAAVPELMMVKARSSPQSWKVYASPIGNTKVLDLSTDNAESPYLSWNNTTPTSSVFSLGGSGYQVNNSAVTYVAYLFATCAGVSKVGSYTGTAALQTVNCGFTSGARFVMIKRTDSTGDWYVWDSVRGISSGNDPYILINSSAAQVTGTNYVDTDTTGFKVTAAAPAGLNASGGTYIFLAVS